MAAGSVNIDFYKYYLPKPKQKEAHLTPEPYVLFGGAMGGGKSWFLCGEAIYNALYFAGNRCVIVRKYLSTAKKTIIITFFKVCPPELIVKYNKSEYLVTLINGSTIQFIEADRSKDPLLDKIKGLEIGWAGIDEANEVDEEVFKILKTRLRHICDNDVVPPYRIVLTSNPENCWLVPTFIESDNPKHKFVQSLTTDNYDENSDYVQTLREAYQNNPEMLERYLGGKWQFGNAINQLIRQNVINKLSEEPKEGHGSFMGCDIARYGNDRSVIWVIVNNKLRYLEIWSKNSLTEISDRILIVAKKFNIPAKHVGIDTVGLGAGTYDNLKDNHNFECIPMVAGAAVDDRNDEFEIWNPLNERSKWFLALQKDTADGFLGGLDDLEIQGDSTKSDEAIKAEISKELSQIRYKIAAGRKLQILSKQELKKLNGKSPDIADGLAIANNMRRYTPPPKVKVIGVVNAGSGKNKGMHKVSKKKESSNDKAKRSTASSRVARRNSKTSSSTRSSSRGRRKK